jgi:pimeloyl-ACP methyl ester carboxylesterase
MDEMLDNIMLYWLPATGASSGRLYWEAMQGGMRMEPITIPACVSMFPKEVLRASRRWAEKGMTDIRYWNELDKGGHFAAFEQPDMFVAEIRNAFRQFR